MGHTRTHAFTHASLPSHGGAPRLASTPHALEVAELVGEHRLQLGGGEQLDEGGVHHHERPLAVDGERVGVGRGALAHVQVRLFNPQYVRLRWVRDLVGLTTTVRLVFHGS